MLTLHDEPFTTGRASYHDADPDNARQQAAIYVQIILPIGSGISVLALLDTGAPYCILDSEVMEELGFSSDEGQRIQLSTRFGNFTGTLQRLTVTLAAEEGDSLEIDATVFVSDEWHHGHFVGYIGFLERLRFAVDPQVNAFHFGPSE